MGVALLALFVALGGTGYAVLSGGIPDKSGVFHGCANRSTGALRLVSSASKCRKKKGKRPGELAVLWSQRGPAGAPGANGTNGTPGANGTTISARLRGSGPSNTTNTPENFPLSPSSWSQAADEVDQLIGTVTYHAPSASDCTYEFFAGSPPTFQPGNLTVSVKVDGVAAGGLIFAQADGNDHTTTVALSSLFETGAAATHNVTAEVSDNCGTGGGGATAARFRVDSVKIDVLAAH